MRVGNWRQFGRALIRGANYYHRYGLPIWRVLPRLLAALISPFFPVAFASRSLYRRRLRICRACPFYDRTLRTCGDGETLIEDTSRNVSVPSGCQCWLPLKARMKDASCFLADIGREPKW